MPGASDNYSMSIPNSPPAPTNISSYSRFMHDHTKRQMEAQGAFEHAASSNSRGRKGTTSGSSSMTNGRRKLFEFSKLRRSGGDTTRRWWSKKRAEVMPSAPEYF